MIHVRFREVRVDQLDTTLANGSLGFVLHKM